MKKRIFSSLLMGALFLASMSMFTSCKDYDDDINSLKSDVATINTSLTTTKSSLESEIASLKTQLEAADATLSTAVGDEATRAKAAEVALAARLTTAESALVSINTALDGKLDKAALKDSLTTIYARLESVETGLGKAMTQIGVLSDGLNNETIARTAAVADLQQQLNALGNLDGTSTLVTKVNELLANVGTISISDLKTKLQALSDEVDAFQAEVNTLNVLIKQSLRSLVFIPQSYYWGIESTELFYLSTPYYSVPATAWNIKESKGYADDTRYASKDTTKVLTFAATYHMNPSSADLTKATVSVLSNDLAFTRSAACGISVKNWNTTTPGILTVNLDVNDPSKIKSVAADNAVTNFATQVKLNNSGKNDTTITSDYATLYKKEVKNLKLAHVAATATNGVTLFAGAPKSVISPCKLDYGHLMQTVHEAGVTFAAQDSCNWNTTLDLRKLVAIHYTDVNGNHKVLSSADIAANFDIKFDLTYFAQGTNATDESAHAAINTDGYTFRPQAVDKDGNQLAYGSEQNRASEVGRTPMVRVTLVDKDTKKVYDYGYIRIKITAPVEDTTKPDTYISYAGKDYTYSGECTLNAWSYSTSWNVTEYDLYKALGLTREEFVANYTQTPDGTATDLDQYTTDGKTFTKLTNKIGVASTVTDASASGDGEMSSTLKWEMTGAQAYKFFVTDAKGGTGIAVKYTSKDKTVGPDVYVLFKTGSTVTINTPSATVAWNKNSTVWAATNATETGTGLDEIHVNVPSVEDGRTTTATPFEQTFSNVFVGNTIAASTVITNLNDKTDGKEYATSKLTLDLIFDASNAKKEYKGISGSTYVMSVSADGKTLNAALKATPGTTQAVAVISGATINVEKITYQSLEYAKDLLNYQAHSALDDNTIKAIVGLNAVNACNKALTLTNNTFNVRFLRPINITNTTKTITDAATTELQTIKLMDLLTFTDWRDAWKTTPIDYATYYGITGVSVAGVANGAKISTNAGVLTDQNGNTTMVPLQSVNGAIDFTYTTTDKGTLTYKNYSSTTAEYKVQIPVIVSYMWGEVPQTITVTVKHTSGNAKKN